MGWFKSLFKGVKKVFKKVFKGVKKLAKKVWKGIKKVGSKVWKGIKKGVKSIGKAVSKLGPLASIAIGFIPGFQALWANAGVWGAMGRGALTGFITSGGNLKATLAGGLVGGAAYGISHVSEAAREGFNSLGKDASFTDKIGAGLSAAGDSVQNGVKNMYLSAENLVSGDGTLNYLTTDPISGKTVSVFQDEGAAARLDGASVYHNANKGYFNDLPEDAQNYLNKHSDALSDLSPNQMNEILASDTSAFKGSLVTESTSNFDTLTNRDGYFNQTQLDADGGYIKEALPNTDVTSWEAEAFEESATKLDKIKDYHGATMQEGFEKYGMDSPVSASAAEYNKVFENQHNSMQATNYKGPLEYTEIDVDTGKETLYTPMTGPGYQAEPDMHKSRDKAPSVGKGKQIITQDSAFGMGHIDVSKFDLNKLGAGEQRGYGGYGYDQYFDVNQLGLHRGTQFASLLQRQMFQPS